VRCPSCEILCSALLSGGFVYLGVHLRGDAFYWVAGISWAVLWVVAHFMKARDIAHFRA